MNIILNFMGLRTGGGRSDALHLLKSIPLNAPQHSFLAILPAECGYEKIDVPKNCQLQFEKVRPLNNLWRLYFDNIVLPLICKNFQADTLFTMGGTGPLRLNKKCAQVLMLRRSQYVYPLSVLKTTSCLKKIKLAFLRWYFFQSLKNSHALIVQTETIKERLYNTTKHLPRHLYVIGKNVSNIKTSLVPVKSEKVQKQINLILSFGNTTLKLLYLTDYYPHKNIEKACQAVALAKKEGIDVVLFLTFGKNKNNKKLFELAEKGAFYNAVVFIDSVEVEQIPKIYKHVDAVLIPSLLESFSATYLEGMAYEKPILASNREFAREICADAAIYFDPLNEKDIAKSIRKVASDKVLSKTLVNNGKSQFKKYDISWDEIAKSYLKVLT